MPFRGRKFLMPECSRLQKGKWPFVKMADSGTSKIGDWCFGLGHPGGFDKSVNRGSYW